MAHNILKIMTQEQGALDGIHGENGAKIGWKDTGTARGRGVFAREFIKEGEIIECVPAIPVATSAIPEEGGAPDGYLLDWDPEEEGQEHCLALGMVMLYNHSESGANIRMESDTGEMTITVFALRNIQPGEELFWDYACDIWFDQD
ncbi:MAG: SET domain-containing protein-lysine N-methyltransferase [Alphaproteobacteria bacterium]|nr:SET domain-containing protein-lysine N-methyltransferase [Alphaproteobacteria bacterium]